MFKQLKTAFTLIELLIVIGVIAILSAGIIIGVRDATRAARETAALVFSTTMKKTMITDMVGEWTFDDETNPGYDSSGKGNHGTLYGDTVWTADGKVRGALEFDGGGDYVNCGSDDSLDITDAVTVSAWINPTVSGSSNYRAVFAKRMLSGGTNYELYLKNDAGVNQGRLSWYSGAEISSSYIPVIGSWTHVLATVSGGTNLKIYANGVEVLSTTINAIATNTGIFAIGRPGGVESEYFDGTIDEVRIYEAALEASQIKARYVEGLNKLHVKGKLDGKEYYQRLTEMGF